MGEVTDLTDIEQQLLMAAAVHGLGPATDLSRASSARVIDQVLLWRGLTAERIGTGWRADDCDPEHAAVYAALVRLTHQRLIGGGFRAGERPGPALFEGSGNWGIPGDPDRPPCWPQYNSCRLTAAGERLARGLLEQHPGYRPSAETRATADPAARTSCGVREPE